MRLTDKECKNAKSIEKPYKIFDGGGMFLEVMPNGSKLWRLKYRYLGKEKRLSLGSYPLVTLAEARDLRDEYKKLLAKDIDPSTAKQDRRREAVRNAANTFEALAREWHENQKGKWEDSYADNVMRKLEMDVFPYIGNRPVKNIEPPELLEVLRKIEKRNALDMAGRTKNICSRVFRYGIQTGRCIRDPSADLTGALKVRKTEHFASIEPKELPELLYALAHNDARSFPITRRLIRFLMLTFVRPGEARQAQWSEIDFQAKQWTIPAERMKMRHAHIIPLSRQAIQLLKDQKEETGKFNTPWVFPSPIRPKNPISENTINKALSDMGFKGRMTAHGFRSLARTAIREELDYAPDVIEQQLAHKAAGSLGEAYDRAKFLNKRKQMMQDWSDYIDKVAKTGKVIQGKFKKKIS